MPITCENGVSALLAKCGHAPCAAVRKDVWSPDTLSDSLFEKEVVGTSPGEGCWLWEPVSGISLEPALVSRYAPWSPPRRPGCRAGHRPDSEVDDDSTVWFLEPEVHAPVSGS